MQIPFSGFQLLKCKTNISDLLTDGESPICVLSTKLGTQEGNYNQYYWVPGIGCYRSSWSSFTVLQIFTLTVTKRLSWVSKNGKLQIKCQVPCTLICQWFQGCVHLMMVQFSSVMHVGCCCIRAFSSYTVFKWKLTLLA